MATKSFSNGALERACACRSRHAGASCRDAAALAAFQIDRALSALPGRGPPRAPPERALRALPRALRRGRGDECRERVAGNGVYPVSVDRAVRAVRVGHHSASCASAPCSPRSTGSTSGRAR